MKDLNILLEKYAELVIRVGVNLQQGQSLIITADLSTVEFARKLALKAYEAGSKYVYMNWSDEESKRIRYMHAPEGTFEIFPVWHSRGIDEMLEEGAAYIQVYSPSPDLMKDAPADRIATAQKASASASHRFRELIQSGYNRWAMASVPTETWAAKLFPDKTVPEAVDALWDCIFRVTRVYETDPVQAWKEHIKLLEGTMGRMNGKRYKALRYRGPGTDLRVELADDHLWVGGDMPAKDGLRFVPNLPTEEIFTMPRRNGVDGVVRSSLPLNYLSTVIDRFTLTFEKGRIVDYTAEVGYETLKKLIETDEGSHYLGEVALVPHDSPVSNLGVIFYNTMFDENAACHLAIGNAYPMNVKDGTTMTKEELAARGANFSLVHVDFMIGSAELDIDGELEDGTLEPLFRAGNWV